MSLLLLLFAFFTHGMVVIEAGKYAKADVEQWEKYKRKYSIFSFNQENVQAFMDNLRFIRTFNAKKNNTFHLGLNEHAHLTDIEYKNLLSKKERRLHYGRMKFRSVQHHKPLPKYFDWREKGIIGRVRDQLSCGSCYSFSTTAAIEAHLKLYRNKSVVLSPQQIVDCSEAYGNDGCQGGMEVYVYEYAMENELYPDNSYPYIHKESKCKKIKKNKGYKIKDYLRVGGQTDQAIETAVAFRGPVTTGIDSRSREFKFYRRGIFYSEKCSQWILDHSVMIVGYSLNSTTPYYIIKNSYGDSWGEEGYFRIKIDDNHCGIATDASFPIV